MRAEWVIWRVLLHPPNKGFWACLVYEIYPQTRRMHMGARDYGFAGQFHAVAFSSNPLSVCRIVPRVIIIEG